MKNIVNTLLLLVVFSVGTKAQESGSVLIQNATLMTITDGIIEDGDILIVDGVITGIGTDLSAPSGVPVVDGTGKYVMPGIIDAHSHLNTVSTNEARNPVTAEVTMEESINPNSVSIYRAIAGGVT